MASEGYHEPAELLQDTTKDMHRALQSMVEELQAITWYNQRIDASADAALQAVLAHNRDEEKEHMVMLLEWVRRRDPIFDAQLHAYLFTEAPIETIEEALEKTEVGEEGNVQAAAGEAPTPALTVGSLLGK